MSARFKWQEEKEAGGVPWQVDGTSEIRKVSRAIARAAKVRRLVKAFTWLVLAAGIVAFLFYWEYETVIRAPGVFEPYGVSGEQVKAPLAGTLVELGASEGETVSRGDLLAVIWPDELDVVRDVENRRLNYELTLDEIRKIEENTRNLAVRRRQLERERDLLASDDSEILALEHRLAASRENLARLADDARRSLALYEREVISRVEKERMTSAHAAAVSEVSALESEIGGLRRRREIALSAMDRELESLDGQIIADGITLAQRKREKEQQSSMLASALTRADRTRIYSPRDGLVVRQEKVAGDRVANGETVFVVSPAERMQVTLRVNPEHFPNLFVGQEALIYSRAVPDSRRESARGRVSVIGSYARPGGEGQYHIPVTVLVEEVYAEIPLGTGADAVLPVPGRRTLLRAAR